MSVRYLGPESSGWGSRPADRVYPEGVAIGATGACVELDEEARVLRVRSEAGGPVELELRPR